MKDASRILVLDANILIRAVLGIKVRTIISDFNNSVCFLTPDACFSDAQKYIPTLFQKRKLNPEIALEVLNRLSSLVDIIEADIYEACKEEALARIKQRDIDDWPIVATALTFNSPIWTEDQDFFGTGIAAWTTDRIHLFTNSL